MPRIRSILAFQPIHREDQRSGLGIEGQIDQRVVVEVHGAVVVEIAFEPGVAGSVVEAGVDAGVVVEVDDAVQIGVAVVGVLDQDAAAIQRLTSESGRTGNGRVLAGFQQA